MSGRAWEGNGVVVTATGSADPLARHILSRRLHASWTHAQRLLPEAEMAELVKVLAADRCVAAPLRGFPSGDRLHTPD